MPPEVKDTPEAPKQAREALQRMGPMSRDQVIMSATMAGAVVLWVLGDQLQIPAVVAAMLGLCSLLHHGRPEVEATAWSTLQVRTWQEQCSLQTLNALCLQ